MGGISSTAEYLAWLHRGLSMGMENCIKKGHASLEKFIWSDLYGAYTPTYYKRTEETLMAWKEMVFITFGNLKSIAHGHPIGYSLEENLVEVLESGYYAYNNPNSPIPARPFFTNWARKSADRYMGAWWRQGMEKAGFKITGR